MQKAIFKLDGGTGDCCVEGKLRCFLNTTYIMQLRDDSDGDNMHHCGFLFCVLQIGNLGVCTWVILPATNGNILICACIILV